MQAVQADAVRDIIVYGLIGGLVLGPTILGVKAFAKWVWRLGVVDLLAKLGDLVEEHVGPIRQDLAEIGTKVNAIEYQTTPNSGGSMRDEVTGVRGEVTELRETVNHIGQSVDRLTADMDRINQARNDQEQP